jgi:hypothetical protein
MRLINHVLQNFIGKFVVICSKNLEEHVEYLQNTLIVLRKECFYANMKKCDFAWKILYLLDMLLVQ